MDNPTIVIKMIGTMITLDAMTRTCGTTSPMTRRIIASAITWRKRVTRPCAMTSPQALGICLNKGVNLVPDHLRALVLGLGLGLAQAAGATATIMLNMTTASQVQRPSNGIHLSTGIRTPRTMMMNTFITREKAILSLLPSLLWWRRRSAPRIRELHQ